MQFSSIIKSKSPSLNISIILEKKPKDYQNKKYSKKFIYKKEKSKVLQSNKLPKNIVFANPLVNRVKQTIKTKNILNNSNLNFRRSFEKRDDININFIKFRPNQTIYLNNPTDDNFNSLNNSNSDLLNKTFFFMNKKGGYITNMIRNNNKWKCTQCGNVNSNFNYLCNNCEMPNNFSDNNNSISKEKKPNLTLKKIRSIDIDGNILNKTFKKRNSLNNTSFNLLSTSLNNDIIENKPILKKKTTYISQHNINKSTNDLLKRYNSNLGNNTIRNNKKINYFYSGDISPKNSQNFNNTIDNKRYNDISQLYSYSNYLSNEIKTSNDSNLKLLEQFKINEKEYNNNCHQNELIKKKIELLKDKEGQLDKINEHLQNSLSYIMGKYDERNKDEAENNNNIINALIGKNNLDQLKNKIKEINKENEELSDKLNANKIIINNIKKKIGELTGDKKIKVINIGESKEIIKLKSLKDLKEKIDEYTKEIKSQSKECDSLDNENKILEQKIKMLKQQIKEEEDNNNNHKINNFFHISSINNYIEMEKDKFMKMKETNNKLIQLFDELINIQNGKESINKNKNNKFNKLKEIYYNMNKNDLINILNDEDKSEKEIIEFIYKYLNLLINRN